jgi:hypothetical protein
VTQELRVTLILRVTLVTAMVTQQPAQVLHHLHLQARLTPGEMTALYQADGW